MNRICTMDCSPFTFAFVAMACSALLSNDSLIAQSPEQYPSEVLARTIPSSLPGFGNDVDVHDGLIAVTDINALQGFPVLSLFRQELSGHVLVGQIRPENIAGSSSSAGGAVSVHAEHVLLSATQYQQFTGRIYAANRVGGLWPTFFDVASAIDSPFEPGAQFGFDIDSTANWLVASAPTRDRFGFNSTGSAAVYERDHGAWVLHTVLEPPIGDVTNHNFRYGLSVAVDGNRIAIAGEGDGAPRVGTAYVYDFDPAQGWIQTQRIFHTAPQYRQYGFSLDLSDDTLVIGEPASGGAVSATGRAYVYELHAGIWSLEATLRSSNGVVQGFAGDQFGGAVAVDGDRIVVGARRVIGLTGSINDGAGYVFRKSPSTGWSSTEDERLLSTNGNDSGLGRRVAMDSGVVVIGSFGATSSSSATASSAYIFTPSRSMDSCHGLASSCSSVPGVAPHLDVIRGSFEQPVAALWGVSPGCSYIVAASFQPPASGGPLSPSRPLCLDRSAFRIAVGLTSANSSISYLSLPLPERAAAVLGSHLTMQVWLRDPQGVVGSSNAVQLRR